MTPEEVALAFVDAINSGQIDKISELMSPDHVFVNSDGTETSGHGKMREAWVRYFEKVPDYRIEVKETFARDNKVAFVAWTMHESGWIRTQSRQSNREVDNRK